VGQLCLDCFFHEPPLGLGPEQLALEIGLRTGPAGCLDFAPGGPQGRVDLRQPGCAVLRGHLFELALAEDQLVPLH